MGPLVEIAYTGVIAVTLHPLRSVVTVLCLVVVLLPYLAGISISQGVQHETEIAIEHGADVHVSGLQFGRRVPLPLSVAHDLLAIDGVDQVTPRIVGNTSLGRDRVDVVIVGLPVDSFPAAVAVIDGRLPGESEAHEMVIGTELARQLRLEIGSSIPPFYRNERGERISKVVGVFRSDVTLWQANLILTSFDAASHIFDQRQRATDFLVECKSGYDERVREQILRTISVDGDGGADATRVVATTRADMRSLLPRGYLFREGIFNLHFLLLFVAAMLVVLVTSGVGLTERRREIGILKATGWQTDEILWRATTESLVLGLLAAFTSLLLAFVWLRLLNGYWIASLFLSGVGAAPSFAIPYRLTPTPAMLAVVISLTVVMTGTLYSTWRASTAAPHSILR